jgi:hypothetical protein
VKVLNKRLISLTSIFLIGACILGYGTKAWFTNMSQSERNTFNAGTLKVQIKDNGNWKSSEGNMIYNTYLLEPGKTKTLPIQVENTGTLDSSYRIRPYIKNEIKFNNASIMDILRVKAVNSNGNVLYNGLFKDLSDESINKNLDSVNGFLKGKSSDIMNFEFYLPGDSIKNKYQDLSAELGFYVDAVQYNHPKVDGLLSPNEYGYSKFDQIDTSNTHSYIYIVDDKQYLYIFMKGYPTGNKAALTINELNSSAERSKITAVADENYNCTLTYEDGTVVPENVAIVKAAEDLKYPGSGQICYEFRIAKSEMHPLNNAVTLTSATFYNKTSTVKVTDNKKYYFKKN